MKKVHRVINFSQKVRLKLYIDKNTKLRQKAKNSLEKQFFKLMNNDAFANTMVNVGNIEILHFQQQNVKETI